MALITFLSLYNFSDLRDVDFVIPYLDKIAHFVFYFVATVLGCLFVRERTRGRVQFQKTLILMGSFIVLYGIFIEILQALYTVERTGELMDFAANLLGVLFALLAVNYIFSPKTRLNWKY